MGDFSDDYGGYDVLGLYEQRDEDRRAQRAKLLTPPTKRAWVDLTSRQFAEILCDDRWQRRPELMLLRAQQLLKELNA